MEKSQLFPDEPWARRCQGLCKRRQSGRSISCHCPLGCEGVLSTPVLPGTMEAGGMLDVQDSGLKAVGLGLSSGLLPVSPLVLQYAHTPVAPHSVWWPPTNHRLTKPVVLWCPHRSGPASLPLQTSPTQTRTSGGWRTCSTSMPMCPSMASGS